VRENTNTPWRAKGSHVKGIKLGNGRDHTQGRKSIVGQLWRKIFDPFFGKLLKRVFLENFRGDGTVSLSALPRLTPP